MAAHHSHDLQRQTSGISTSSSKLSRAFLGLSLAKHTAISSEQLRGPLGLNLLSAPNDPSMDLVFIHGLGGGSRKTWSKSPDSASFWPKEWLPQDQELKDVRIHSFGYDSDWASRSGSTLGIHDFGRDFLAALQASPIIRRSEKVIKSCLRFSQILTSDSFLSSSLAIAWAASS